MSSNAFPGLWEGERIKDGPLPVREVYEIMLSVADGLSCAHDKGIVHRDVKPGNVIITSEGFVKIVDFGLAKLADRSRLTRTGHTPGTLSYMSPEQVEGGELDGRADIWSLGVLAYEALTGKLPFEADVDPAMMYRILNEEPAPIGKLRSDVPAEFVEIIHKCLAKDTAGRYECAADLMRDLAAMGGRLGWQSSGTYRTVMRVGTASAAGRKRLVASMIVASAVVAIAATLWTAFGRSRQPALYTTEVRLAVLPLENLAGGSVTPEFANGLSEWITRVLERLSARHPSMWVVPFDQTQPGLVAAPSHAKDAFGVNRIVTGTIERYGNGLRVSLTLKDAGSLRRIREASIDYEEDATVIEREVPQKAAELAGLRPPVESRPAPALGFTSRPKAFEEYLRGLGYLQRYRVGDNLNLAARSFRASVAADSLFAEARATLALALAKRCTLEKRDEICAEATAGCRAALVLDSTGVGVNLAAAAVAFEQKRYDEALAAYRRILTAEPKNAAAYRHMGYIFNRMDRVAEAEAAYRAAAAAQPDCWLLHGHLGWFLGNRDREDEALDQYEKALALAPGDPWTINTLGNIALEKDEWGKARELFLRSFAIQPRCLPCRNIGLLYYLEGLFAESATYFKFALEYCDSASSSHYQRWQDLGAALYWVEGKRPEAEAAFRHAVQLAEDPNVPDVLAYTAGCYAMLGDRDRALALIDRFIAIGSEDPHALFVVGQTYEQLGDRERALSFIGEAVRLNYRLSWIEAEPILKDLTKDIRFRQLVAAKTGEKVEEGARSR